MVQEPLHRLHIRVRTGAFLSTGAMWKLLCRVLETAEAMSALGILTLLANGRSSVSSLVDRICMSGDSGERASDLGPKALIAREKPRVLVGPQHGRAKGRHPCQAGS
mmetsp:Transcript_17285/g.48190  ORF Transcript_17285/g.48190 Transcript_17285/m.48190 type:complete len:107 (+) Transcript_17285:917-1237(+)